MEKKLTLREIVPYLPYKLKYIDKDSGEITTMKTISAEINLIDLGWGNAHELKEFKPILRPLSDLFNGQYDNILDEFSELGLEVFKIAFLSELKPLNAFDKINYTIVIKLFENHFDMFGLIDNGLAIDINTL